MKIKITEVDRFVWQVSQVALWMGFMILQSTIALSLTDIWSVIGIGARILTAFWLVNAYRSARIHYDKWREEKIHTHIRPILTEPPEIP